MQVGSLEIIYNGIKNLLIHSEHHLMLIIFVIQESSFWNKGILWNKLKGI